MKRIIAIVPVVLLAFSVFGQTSTKNYVKSATARQATTSSIISSSSHSLTKQSVQYMDGLGRPVQSIIRWGSPAGNDMVTLVAYDTMGRQAKSYLPYEVGQSTSGFRSSALTEQNTFYGGDYPYSEKRFETSPLSRVLEQGAPGASWRIGQNTIDYEYQTNTASEVKLWEYSNLQVSARDFYSANMLYKTTTTDEDGNPTISYINSRGQTILQKSFVPGSPWAETYYIYDELDRLRVVLPPQAILEVANRLDAVNGYTNIETSQNVTSDGNYVYTMSATVTIPPGTTITRGHITPLEVLSPEFLADWAFQYDYDERNRMIMKQVPGADPVYMVYDQWDRLVLTQDGNQREGSEWLFTRYDALNRPVMTGKKVIPGTLQSIRNEAMAFSNRYESYDGGSLLGYSNDTYPSNVESQDLLTVTYYDNYDFVDDLNSLELHNTDYQDVYEADGAFRLDPEKNTNVKGQVTGSLVRFGPNDFIESITYYDHKYRPIQIVSTNHLDGIDITSNQFDFVGNIRRTRIEHSDGNLTTIIEREFDYDHLDRLTHIWHKVDNEEKVLLAMNTYNAIGQLENKKLHGDLSEGTVEQAIDYQYNIRGWLTDINDPNNIDASHLFGSKLHYTNNPFVSNNVNYNGNISAMEWSNYDSDNSGISERAYSYSYDGLNRLTAANHYQNGSRTSNSFDVTIPNYDLNGNIQNLTRKGKNGSNVDNLTYTYSGNQLLKVTDSFGTEGFDNSSSGSGNDYTYDANGNMTSDANKGITNIDYNHLNLPTRVDMGGNDYITYLYDAAGIKLQQTVFEGGSQVKETDYVGEFIYEDGTIQFVQHEEGRVVSKGSDWDYQYHLKDHLGNVRLTFSTTPEEYIMEEDFEGGSNGFQDLNPISNSNNTTPGGSKVNLITEGETGAMMLLSINKGDQIDMSVQFFLENQPSSNTLANVASGLFNDFSSSVYGSGEGASATLSEFNQALSGMTSKGSNTSQPMAFMNYIFFDKNMNYVTAGFRQTLQLIGPSGPVTNSGYLHVNDLTLDQDGYLLAYLSNESHEEMDALFDSFTITQTKTNVVSTQDYYPFGGTFNSYTSGTENLYKYQGKEEQQELETFDFHARMYDPMLGRTWQIDPMSDLFYDHSPYSWVKNNPLLRIDPTGMTDFTFDKKSGEVSQVGEANDEPDRILRTNRKGEVKYKKNGEAKVAMGGIEQGILADGQNWKTDDQVIEVGGEGQPTADGVESFTLGLSEYIGKELSGYSYSSDGSGNVTDMLIGNYENNSRTESSSSPADLIRKYRDSYSHDNIQGAFHTHPDGKLGATQSAPHQSADVQNLQRDKPSLPNASFYILYRVQGQSKPAKYDYTHEYRAPRKKK